MKLIDTHAHIYEPEFDDDREEAIRRARKAGVAGMLLPAIDSQSHDRLLDLCREYPETCRPMMGLHPTSINDNPRWEEELSEAERLLRHPPAGGFCAVGEIGLDFYWSADFRDAQMQAFRHQVSLALELGLPIAVHTRAAWPEMIGLIESYRGRGLRGVFHAYGEDFETYRRLRDCGEFVFGIGGVVTFRKSVLAEVVRDMELSDMVLETDCPYLTPVPYRGRRNEPAYVAFVCNRIAELKEISPQEVAEATSANAERIFGPLQTRPTARGGASAQNEKLES